MIAEGRASTVFLSAISIWEVALSASRKRLDLGMPASEWFDHALNLPGLTVTGIEPAIALDAAMLPGSFHKDPADRLIVATARRLEVPLVTADKPIIAYAAAGHLQAIDARH